MINVVCVLKTGGDFSREWVINLKHGLNRYLSDFQFYCITDDASVTPVWRIPLKYAWPKWWCKMALFEPGILDGPTLYLDLDTLPVGELDDIASCRSDFAMITDLLRIGRPGKQPGQSGVLFFRPGSYVVQRIWETWMKDPAGHMKRHRGDGEFLHSLVPDAPRLQTLFPGQVVSLKREAKRGPPASARLVCGHGRPRLSDPRAGWAHTAWRRGWPPETKEAA